MDFSYRFISDADGVGQRLDRYMASVLEQFSRTQITDWIKTGAISVNGQVQKQPRYKCQRGDQIEIDVCVPDPCRWQPQSIPLELVEVDEHIIVVNKQAGLTVHPGAGQPDGTLINGLLYRFPELEQLPRAGLVHRLDKDTTGLMVVARSHLAHVHLTRAIEQREVRRQYLALVVGSVIAGETLRANIQRSPTHRTRMTTCPDGMGRRAVTHTRVKQRFQGYTLLDVSLETGRTHQIRVHMRHWGHPIVGDPVYGRGGSLPGGLNEELRVALRDFSRQALHAYQLGFVHPAFPGSFCEWQAEWPEDFARVIELLTVATSKS